MKLPEVFRLAVPIVGHTVHAMIEETNIVAAEINRLRKVFRNMNIKLEPILEIRGDCVGADKGDFLVKTQLDRIIENALDKKIDIMVALRQEKEAGPRLNQFGFKGTERDRMILLQRAADKGASFVSLEGRDYHLSPQNLDHAFLNLKPEKTHLIRDFHSWETLSDNRLREEYLSLLEKRGDIIKMAISMHSTYGLYSLLKVLGEHSHIHSEFKPGFIALGMGNNKLARLSRILSPLYQGYLTFASANTRRTSAPGQMNIWETAEKFYDAVELVNKGEIVGPRSLKPRDLEAYADMLKIRS